MSSQCQHHDIKIHVNKILIDLNAFINSCLNNPKFGKCLYQHISDRTLTVMTGTTKCKIFGYHF